MDRFRVTLLKFVRWTLSLLLYYSGIWHLYRKISWRVFRLRPRFQVLRYHRIYARGEQYFYNFGISVDNFRAQMQFLKKHFHLVSLNEIVKAVRGEIDLPHHSIAITFDDGYRDNLEYALPVLKEMKIPATLFVTTEFVGNGNHAPWWEQLALGFEHSSLSTIKLRLNGKSKTFSLSSFGARRKAFLRTMEYLKQLPDQEMKKETQEILNHLLTPATNIDFQQKKLMLSWDEVKIMNQQGIEIGSHTVSHPILSRIKSREIVRQVSESKQQLQEKLGIPIRFFSFPNGRPEDIPAIAKVKLANAGYEAAFTSVSGWIRPGDELYLLKRKGVYEGTSTAPNGKFSRALFALELIGFFDILFLRRGKPHG